MVDLGPNFFPIIVNEYGPYGSIFLSKNKEYGYHRYDGRFVFQNN